MQFQIYKCHACKYKFFSKSQVCVNSAVGIRSSDHFLTLCFVSYKAGILLFAKECLMVTFHVKHADWSWNIILRTGRSLGSPASQTLNAWVCCAAQSLIYWFILNLFACRMFYLCYYLLPLVYKALLTETCCTESLISGGQTVSSVISVQLIRFECN